LDLPAFLLKGWSFFPNFSTNDKARSGLSMKRLSRDQLGFPPLTMTFNEVAAQVFRRSDTWLRRWLRSHPDFPQPDELGLFSTKQVERWLDKRFSDPDQGSDAAFEGVVAGSRKSKI
jgi:hypothetical protein